MWGTLVKQTTVRHVHGDSEAGWRDGNHWPGNKSIENCWYLHADIYIEGSLAEFFVYVFASERVARRVELTPGCRHIQALSWRTKWLAESPWNKGLQFRAGSQAHSLDVGFSKFMAASWQIALWCSGAWRSLQAEWKLNGRAALFVCPFAGHAQPLPRSIVYHVTRRARSEHDTHTNYCIQWSCTRNCRKQNNQSITN